MPLALLKVLPLIMEPSKYEGQNRSNCNEPLSSASSAEISSIFWAIKSASLLSSIPRLDPGQLSPQVVLKAVLAALTALSTSAEEPRLTFVISFPVAVIKLPLVSVLRCSLNLPGSRTLKIHKNQ